MEKHAGVFTPTQEEDLSDEGDTVILTARMVCGNGANDVKPEGDDRLLEICVADSGIGIRPEDRERIFEPFPPPERGFRRRYQGSGLGLTLAWNLVELHGGRFWLESEGLGKGSSFRFILPL